METLYNKDMKVSHYLIITIISLVLCLFLHPIFGRRSYISKMHEAEKKINTVDAEWKTFTTNLKGADDLEMLPDHSLLREILVRGIVPDEIIKGEVKDFLRANSIYEITSVREIIVDKNLYSKRQKSRD